MISANPVRFSNQLSRQPLALKRPYVVSRHGTHLTTVLTSLRLEVARTQEQPGWVLVLGSPVVLTKQLLEHVGLASHRILVLPAQKLTDMDKTVRDALTCNTCQAVLTFIDDAAQLAEYQYLATKYQTRLVNHCNQFNQPMHANEWH